MHNGVNVQFIMHNAQSVVSGAKRWSVVSFVDLAVKWCGGDDEPE